MGTGLFAGVLEGANLLTDAGGISSLSHQFFQMFVPGLQKNEKEKDWYWFDMLHYRQTGNFAYNLVKSATSNREKALAFGYLSHIATDVVGHAYVNQIVGTAYRLNVHRHVTAENLSLGFTLILIPFGIAQTLFESKRIQGIFYFQNPTPKLA